MGEPYKTFATLNCLALDLRFEVAKDKFDWEKFLAVVEVEKGASVCNTQFPDRSDFHVHLGWRVRKKEVTLSISYVEPGIRIKEKEKEPYTETAMAWAGAFFKNETAHADIGAYFRYESAIRQSRFPLPIKLPIIPDLETQIDGVSFDLPSKPNGVAGALITMDSAHMSVQLRGGIRVNFKEFEAIEVADSLSSIALKFGAKKILKTEKNK